MKHKVMVQIILDGEEISARGIKLDSDITQSEDGYMGPKEFLEFLKMLSKASVICVSQEINKREGREVIPLKMI